MNCNFSSPKEYHGATVNRWPQNAIMACLTHAQPLQEEKNMSDHNQLLKRLGLEDVNPGACFGPGQFAEIREENLFDSINPTTGGVIARISAATVEDRSEERRVGNTR